MGLIQLNFEDLGCDVKWAWAIETHENLELGLGLDDIDFLFDKEQQKI